MNVHDATKLAYEHYQSGNLQQAEYIFKNLLDIQPNDFDICNSLGNVLQDKGCIDEAIYYYYKSIELNPEFGGAYYNLADALVEKGNLDEAIQCYQKSIELKPDFAFAYNNLGIAFSMREQFEEALQCYQKAVVLNPKFDDAYYNLGSALNSQGKQADAVTAYHAAVRINPNHIKARWAYCISQLPIIYSNYSDILTYRGRYRDELNALHQLIRLESPYGIEVAAATVGSHQPFFLPYQGMNDRELQQCYGEMVCKIMASKYPQYSACSPMLPHPYGEPLRVGIVSGFFHNHSNWKIPIKGWIENIDKKRISLYGYYTGKKKDQLTDNARMCFKRFVEDIHSFEDLCEIIRRDNLHVLIYPEIGMDSITVRLASLRLSPVQCASWGHPETSGFPTIDYFLSSELMEPPHAERNYCEKLILLPNLSIYYEPLDISPLVIDRSDFGLRPKSILFHCCQSLFKFLPQYDDVFPRIARQVGDCQFLFTSYPNIKSVIGTFRLRINEAFRRFHLNMDHYVVILPFLDGRHFQALNRLSDIYLDSIGWSGCNTTLEAVEYGLPIVTLSGELMRGRHTAAILTMMGMQETIAASLDEYISLAVKLGKDSEWRQQISKQILVNKHLVYQDKTCITALENFLYEVVKEKLA